MKSLVLSRTEELLLPEIALFIFVAVFAIALWKVLRPGARQHYAAHRSMALDAQDLEDDRG